MKMVRILLVLALCGAANVSQAMWTKSSQTGFQRLAASVRSFAQRHITQPPKSVVIKRAFCGAAAGFSVNAFGYWHQVMSTNTFDEALTIDRIRKPVACGAAYFVGGPVGFSSYGLAQTTLSKLRNRAHEEWLKEQKK